MVWIWIMKWYVFVFILPQVGTTFLLSSFLVITTLFSTLLMPNQLPLLHLCYNFPDCPRKFKSSSGFTWHCNMVHRVFTPSSEDGEEDENENTYTYHSHPFLNGKCCWFSKSKAADHLLITDTVNPCDVNGGNLPDPPPAPPTPLPIDGQDPASWKPFGSQLEFNFA